MAGEETQRNARALIAYKVRCEECDAHDRLYDYEGLLLCEECAFAADEKDSKED